MPHTLLYFLALASLSSSANWAKLNHMPVEVLGFYRLAIAAALVGLWILLIKRPLISPPRKTLLWVVLSGVFFFLHLWTYKFAAKNTSVSNTVILFASNPVWASLGAIVFFRESVTRRLLISYVLALMGVYLLVAHDFGLRPETRYGDWSALLSAVFYSAYMLTGKKARLYYGNTFYSFVQYAICAGLFYVCTWQTGAPLGGYDPLSWYAVAGLVILPTFVGHFSMTYLVRHMDLTLMSCGKLIEPVLASIMAYYMFHEFLNPYAWIAFTLTATAVLVLFGPALRRQLVKYAKKFVSS